MRIYFDPSVLVALYIPEPLSSAARELVEESAQPVLLNELQELEFKNGIRQKVVRREISESELARSLRIFDDDIVEGKIEPKEVVWRQIYAQAQTLSRRFSTKHICRSYDLLHVAIAVVSKVRRFATFDAEQRKLARAAGLKPVEFTGA